jgi:hypothetical protein
VAINQEPNLSRGRQAAGPVDATTPTTLHYGWLHQGRDIHVRQQCCLPYDIKPFKDEVLCDISSIEVCDVLLGHSYLWK